MMTILFDATRPVKTARKSTFGQGIAPARRPRFVPSAADRAWAAFHLNANATDYDVIEPAHDRAELRHWESYPEWDAAPALSDDFNGAAFSGHDA